MAGDAGHCTGGDTVKLGLTVYSQSTTLMLWAFPDSHDLFLTRPVRTRMSGGMAGAQLTAAPCAN